MAGLKDVARYAGVSVSTVSNVINGHHQKMRSETLNRVQNAIAELHYTPSTVARQLKSGQIRTLGLIIPSVANPFWGTTSHLIEQAALERGYHVLICNAERDPELEVNYVESLYGSGIRGVILGSSPVSFDHLRMHVQKGVVVAALDRKSQGAQGVVACSVGVDQFMGARLATRHLIGLGHKRIAFLSGPIGTSGRIGRLEGMRSELAKAGIVLEDQLVWLGPNVSGFGDAKATELGRIGIRDLLTLDNPPTAVFTVNDMCAIGACAGARELGYRVPEDLSVVGFDDIVISEVMQPPLTTIRQPINKMTKLIVDKLIDALENENGVSDPHIELRPELVVRASTSVPGNVINA